MRSTGQFRLSSSVGQLLQSVRRVGGGNPQALRRIGKKFHAARQKIYDSRWNAVTGAVGERNERVRPALEAVDSRGDVEGWRLQRFWTTTELSGLGVFDKTRRIPVSG